MVTSTSSATTGSNIDVASIVSQLMTVERRPLTALATREASIQSKISAYGSISGALSGFQGAMAGLNNASRFQGLVATSSDSSYLTASPDSTAATGSYAIDVFSLAQAQKLVATGQASQTAAIGAGGTTTLTFDFGTISGGTLANGKYTGAAFTSNGKGTKTVTIDSSNNSLQGMRDAINAANIGVTASIVNDGGGTPYRLSLSSNSMGADNSIKISVAGDAAISALLAHDPANNAGQALSETTAAQSANFSVNGVSVSKSSNSVSDVIQGLTLNLTKVTTSTINLTVSKNIDTVTAAVNNLVSAYNDLHKTLHDLSAYDAATGKSAILQGDFAVRTIDAQVRRVLSTPITGGGELTNLSQIGVGFQKDGTLKLDSAKLSTAIANNFGDIAALFAKVGKASDSLISYTSATSSVKAGSYAVNVSQIATQGNVAGLAAVGTTTITAGSNDTLSVSVDGTASIVTLAAGTYTAASLAAEVQAKINGDSTLSAAGASVAVTQSGGIFTITSNRYGSVSAVAIGGNGANNLLGGAPVPTAGMDVAGTIEGQPATGSGQYLTSGGGDSMGLKIQVNGGALGARGTVSYSYGYGYLLDQLASTMLGKNGLLSGKTAGLNKSIADIAKQRDALNTRLVQIQTNYTRQFSKLDAMLTSMNSTSNYLSQQLANLPKAN